MYVSHSASPEVSVVDVDRAPLIAVFAKPPVAGEVKTRLASVLGTEVAASLAGAFLTDVLATVRPLPWARVVIATTGSFAPEWADIVEGLPLWDQGLGHLGRRMEAILARGLHEGAPLAIALGADVPGLPTAHLERARDLLEDHDAVLGPAHDGGYYLVGLRRCPEGVFEEVPWSVPETFERTRARFEQLGLSVAVGEPFGDVDEPADLYRLEADLRAGRLWAPATTAALNRLSTRARAPKRPPRGRQP